MRRPEDRVPVVEEPKTPSVNAEGRKRVRGVTSLVLGSWLVAIAALGVLAIWHLVRRGRLIRERLGAPRPPRPLIVPEPLRSTEIETDV